MKLAIILLVLTLVSCQVKRPQLPLEVTLKLDCITGDFELTDNAEFIFQNSYFLTKPQDKAQKIIQNDYTKQCQEAFVSMLAKQDYITKTKEKSSLNNSFYYKMPGLFSMHDGHSRYIYICFQDRTKQLHSEMSFFYKVQQFVDSLSNDYYIKEKAYFLIYTYSSPCLSCMENYRMIGKYYQQSKFDIYFSTIYTKNNNIKFLLSDSRLSENDIKIDSTNYLPKLEQSLFREQCSVETDNFYRAYNQFLLNFYKNTNKPLKAKENTESIILGVMEEDKKDSSQRNKKRKNQDTLSPPQNSIKNIDKEELEEVINDSQNTQNSNLRNNSPVKNKITDSNQQRLKKDNNKKIYNQVMTYSQFVKKFYSKLNGCYVEKYSQFMIHNGNNLPEKKLFYSNFDFHTATTIPDGNEIKLLPNLFSFIDKDEFKRLHKLTSLNSILSNTEINLFDN